MTRRDSISGLLELPWLAGALFGWALLAGGARILSAQTPVGSNAPSPAESTSAIPDAPPPQSQVATLLGPKTKSDATLAKMPVNILRDQAAIWTSPARFRERDLALWVPVVLAATVTMTTDHQVMSSSKLDNTSLNNRSVTASNGLTGAFVAAPVLFYGLGHIRHDDHDEETGILGGEAMVDSLVADEVMKVVSMRERPMIDGAHGKFFQSGINTGSSFPSTHSMIAWSSAAVIASEYPGPLTQIAAYGLATGVSLTRVLGKQHFPSDVVVGSAVGWMIGRYVYRKHRKQDAGY